VTAAIHPDNLAMAEAVARVLEMPTLGLDFMTDDIARSWKEGHCGINEVNSEPAFSLHQRATSAPRDVVTPYLDQVFGPECSGPVGPGVCDLEDDERALALAVAEVAALDYVGIDMARENGRCLLIETNAYTGGHINFDVDHRAKSGDDFALMIRRLAEEGRR
jgi:D-alanine-D-alanine ligase-like ATP-grasp enzyme